MHSNTATAAPNTGRSRRRVRLLIALLGAAVAVLPILVSSPSTGARVAPPERRAAYAPNVMFPIAGGRAKDLKTSRGRRGTDLAARCGSIVRAAHPGTVYVSDSPWSGPNLVRVVSSVGRLVTWYGHMSNAWVRTGQIVQSGQPLGPVGHAGNATRCGLYFSVTGSGGARTFNASWWLNRYVGKPAPTVSLFDNSGFNLASFNTLGASHTPKGRFAGYYSRTTRQVSYLNSLNVDVVGLQEFQKKQRNLFLQRAGDTYGIYPESDKQDTENSLIWRNSTMEYLSGTTIDIPYFNGHIRKMPVVLLRHRESGREAYFINVHNPATLRKYGNQAKWRAKAIAVERAKIIELRATGRAVFLTGDLNDRARAFCPLTRGKLMLAANSIPSMNCSMPKQYGIDWVLAAGPARFSRFTYTWTPKNLKLTDHPIVMARTHLAPMEQ